MGTMDMPWTEEMEYRYLVKTWRVRKAWVRRTAQPRWLLAEMLCKGGEGGKVDTECCEPLDIAMVRVHSREREWWSGALHAEAREERCYG